MDYSVGFGCCDTEAAEDDTVDLSMVHRLFLLAAAVRTVAPQGEPAYLLITESAVTGLTLTLFLIGAGLSWS